MKSIAANRKSWLFVWPVMAIVLMLTSMAPLPSQAAEPKGFAYLPAKKRISAPDGFAGLCAAQGWACARSSVHAVSQPSVLKLADKINRSVNRTTRQISDREQYKRDEFWALPTARGGDCEDLVLLKKLKLLQANVPASALLMATVLDLKGNRHAVLILRTAKGDLVLDSLDNRIRHWVDTGYTFLKLQDPNNPQVWNAIFAGGRIPVNPDHVIAMK